MSIDLPPLRPFDTYADDGYTHKDYCDDGLYVTVEEVEARERILLARIAELEADAERLDSGRIMFTTRDVYGDPAKVTFAGVDLRAAIDAARRCNE